MPLPSLTATLTGLNYNVDLERGFEMGKRNKSSENVEDVKAVGTDGEKSGTDKVTGFRFRSGKQDCNPTLNGIVFQSGKVYTQLSFKKAVSAGTGQATAEREVVELTKHTCKHYIGLLKKKYPKLTPSFEPVKAADLID